MPSTTFGSQSGYQQWNVPKGVSEVVVDVKGGGSGSTQAGRVQGVIRVNDDMTLFLLVGGAGNGASGRQGGLSAVGGGAPGGDASTGNNGGAGGGGASAIRINSNDGTIKCVAGGAGGHSGDSGAGGPGGGSTGGHGNLGTAGTGQAGNATGGTQIQGGNGGASAGGAALTGSSPSNSSLTVGGRGGQQTSQNTQGGGGGGGGYRAGGGGVAGLIGVTPGGGGAGGSNYTGGILTSVSSGQGTGGTGDGSITLTWISKDAANQPPSAPSQVKINGVAESTGMSTKSTGRLKVSAIVNDPDTTQHAPTHTGGPETQTSSKARLVVQFATSTSFAHMQERHSDFVDRGKRAEVDLAGLAQNTHYYMRLYAEDPQGLRSLNYNGVNLWTNRAPTEPTLQGPADNAIILTTDTTTFNWNDHDPDAHDPQAAFTFRYRRSAEGNFAAGPWTDTTFNTSFDNYTVNPGVFKSGVYYDWTIRTQDGQGQWGPFAAPRTFTVLGTSAAPKLTYPVNDEAVDVSEDVTFTWKFKDPSAGEIQVKADLRYRAVGSEQWVTVIGNPSPDVPGYYHYWTFAPGTFEAGVKYEWSVETYHTADPLASDWADSETFWAHGALGGGVQVIDTALAVDQGNLGCGHHRAYIYDRGGEVLRGEVTPLVSINWTRNRDDLGTASITTNGFGDDCGALLKTVHTWVHELVIFRDGVRVFEGPITLVEDATTGFTIQAKDVMGYVYRRIMKQGYNDSYHVVDGVVEGIRSVVQRAGMIIANALAPNDPNVLPYLTLLQYDDDAQESRIRFDYQSSAWDEVDDMAANAGLDYSVIGRRIILNDTHRPVGRLAEWRTEHFSDPPKITEYGMLLADYYAATNNAGVWGASEHADTPYGGIEILVSSFSEVAGGSGEVLTKAKTEALRKVLVKQAKRGIASRYPAPYIVRVPDNSTLSADTPVGINQLVPGVWIPLRAKGTLIEISQWQKLDQVSVTETADQAETVQVTMSPAPNRGEDPDAAAAAEAADA